MIVYQYISWMYKYNNKNGWEKEILNSAHTSGVKDPFTPSKLSASFICSSMIAEYICRKFYIFILTTLVELDLKNNPRGVLL